MPHRTAAAAAAPPRKGTKKPPPKARPKVHKPTAAERPDGLRPGTKMATMIDMALRPIGATEAQICAAIGWKKCRVTLKRTADKAGYELATSKNDAGETVWKASAKKTAA